MNKRNLLICLTLFLFLSLTAGSGYDDGVANQWVYPPQNNTPCGGYICPVPPYYVYDRAEFIADITIPDGTYIAPGTNFNKTWRIRNVGTSTWNAGYRLVFSSGTQMTSLSSVPLPYIVAPGQSVDITIAMNTPVASGNYKSNWMLRSDNGNLFGVGYNGLTPIWVQICTIQYVAPAPAPCAWPNYCQNPCYGYWCPSYQPSQNPYPYPYPYPNPFPKPQPWPNNMNQWPYNDLW